MSLRLKRQAKERLRSPAGLIPSRLSAPELQVTKEEKIKSEQCSQSKKQFFGDC